MVGAQLSGGDTWRRIFVKKKTIIEYKKKQKYISCAPNNVCAPRPRYATIKGRVEYRYVPKCPRTFLRDNEKLIVKFKRTYDFNDKTNFI